MKKVLLMLVVLVGTVVPANAAYYVRGEFNNWGGDYDTLMVDDGDGTFSATVTGLTPGDRTEFKVAEDAWVNAWPGSNSKTIVDAAGEITFHFIPGVAGDGWNPAENRVGYDDPGQFGWEAIGSFEGWNGYGMTNLGGGMYSATYNVATAGSYEFKFREAGDWNINIGDDFGNSAANNWITTTSDNQDVIFELDLPNGRWNATVVPEPATMLLLGLGSLVAIRRKK